MGEASPAFLVTGSARGLGFQFVKQILADVPASTVVATVRNINAAGKLDDLSSQYGARLHVVQLDAADPDSVKAGLAKVAELLPSGLDYLICNAGITGEFNQASQDPLENIQGVLRINFFGVLDTIQQALPLLRKGSKKTIASISSSLGSLSGAVNMLHSTPESPFASTLLGYKSGKAAVNMANIVLAADLKADGFTVVGLDPGWVATDMGTSSAAKVGMTPPLKPEDSVAGMMKVLLAVSPEQSGAVLDREGKPCPW